jgi:hypothetical protein
LVTSRIANAALEGLEERRKREVVEEGPVASAEEVAPAEGEGPTGEGAEPLDALLTPEPPPEGSELVEEHAKEVKA